MQHLQFLGWGDPAKARRRSFSPTAMPTKHFVFVKKMSPGLDNK